MGRFDYVGAEEYLGALLPKAPKAVVSNASGACTSTCPKCGAHICLSVRNGNQITTSIGALPNQDAQAAQAAADAMAAEAAAAQAQAQQEQTASTFGKAQGTCKCPKCGAALVLTLAARPVPMKKGRAVIGMVEEVGFGFDTILPVAGTLLTAGGQIAAGVEADEARTKATAADKGKLEDSISADSNAVDKAALAAMSEAAAQAAAVNAVNQGRPDKAKTDKARADAAAASLAQAKSDKAGALVPASLQGERLKRAETALAVVTDKLQKSPSNAALQAQAAAWDKQVTRCSGGQIASNAPDAPGKRGDSVGGEDRWYGWFTRKSLISSVPNGVTVGGGVGIVGLGWLAVKRHWFSRIFG